jgi:hypothetical protein
MNHLPKQQGKNHFIQKGQTLKKLGEEISSTVIYF